MSSLKRLLAALIAAVMLVAALAAVPALAEGEDDAADVTDTDTAETSDVPAAAPGRATNIAAEVTFDADSEVAWDDITDANDATHSEIGVGTVKIASEQPIAGVYLKFRSKTAAWTLKAGGSESEHGQDGFLHEFVGIEPSTEITLEFPRGADLCGIELYTEGDLPASVQVWNKPIEDGADFVLLAAQAGDEHTYMGGVLPLALDAGARCQVVYFCSHDDDPVRMHETLNGLWAIGMKNYPVLGSIKLEAADSVEELKEKYKASGIEEDDFVEWIVENIRRFCPQVLMIPCEEGDGGDFVSAICSEAAKQAVVSAADDKAYPISLTSYGKWDTPKTYVHLCKDGAITLDLDAPLASYGGRSAYEMACVGFAEHGSIHWTARFEWLMGLDQVTAKKDPDAPRYTSATQIEEYNPAKWGLWRSNVGDDKANDLFDNVTLYDQQSEVAEQGETDLDGTAQESAVGSGEGVLLPGTEKNGGGNSERNKFMFIIVICGVLVIAGTALALILSSAKSRSDAKKKKLAHDRIQARSEENARRVRDARSVRARLDSEEDADSGDDAEGEGAEAGSDADPDSEDAPATRTVASSTREPSGKGAEREAAIKAARVKRDAGASQHEKPTDKKY